jgi:hypothetical protein
VEHAGVTQLVEHLICNHQQGVAKGY